MTASDAQSEDLSAAPGPGVLHSRVLQAGGFQRPECAMLLQAYLARDPQCHAVRVHALTGEIVFTCAGREPDVHAVVRATEALGYSACTLEEAGPASDARQPLTPLSGRAWVLGGLLTLGLVVLFFAHAVGPVPLLAYLVLQMLLAAPALSLLGGRTCSLAWRGLCRKLVQVHLPRAAAALLLFIGTPLAAAWHWFAPGADVFLLGHGALAAVLVLLLDQAGLRAWHQACHRLHHAATEALQGLPEEARKIWFDAHRRGTPTEAFILELNGLLLPAALGVALLTGSAWLLLPDLLLQLGALAPGRDAPASLGTLEAGFTGLRAAVAVLLVLSPGAFLLSALAPAYLGAARAADVGMLPREAALLDTLRQVRVCAFARSGILVEARAAMVEAAPLGSHSRAELLRHAARAAAGSPHLLARAVAGGGAAEAESKAELLPGKGIRLEGENERLLLGNAALLRRFGVNIQPAQHLRYRFACEGRASVLVARDAEVLGVLAFHQRLRPESVRTLRALRELGMRLVLLTGLDKQAAGVVAEQLGLTEVYAHADAAEKAVQLVALRQETIGAVAFCGDPEEDPPALAAADVGLAWGALEAGAWEDPGNVLIDARLDTIPRAFRFARTLHRLEQSQFAALILYHALLLPLAMLGLLHPVAAAALGSLPPALLLLHALRKR